MRALAVLFLSALPAIAHAAPAAVDVRTLGADGARDATAVIQRALNDNAGKAAVLIPKGVTYTLGTLQLPSDTHFVIDGTIIQRPGNNGQFVNAKGKSNILIEGTGTIDGNRDQQNGKGLACVNIYDGFSNLTIRGGLTIKNCKSFPINAWLNGSKVRISNVRLLDSGNSAQCAAIVDDCWVDRIYVSGVNDYGWAFYGGVTNSGITRSVLTGNNAGGITVLSDKGQPKSSSNILIAGNIASYNIGSGISAQVDRGGIGNHSGIVISYNVADHNNQGNLPGYGGIRTSYVTNSIIRGNIVHDDGKGPNSSIGISSGPNNSEQTISDNIVYNIGKGSTVGVGISVANTAKLVTITGNTIYDNQPEKTMAYALNGAFGDNSRGVVSGNNLSPTLGTSNNLKVANDTFVFQRAGKAMTIHNVPNAPPRR